MGGGCRAEGPSLAARPGPPPLVLPGEGGIHTRAHLLGLGRTCFQQREGFPRLWPGQVLFSNSSLQTLYFLETENGPLFHTHSGAWSSPEGQAQLAS